MQALISYWADQLLASGLSASSVYQILVGKGSSSTYFNAYKYDLTGFFGLAPKLTKAEFKMCLEQAGSPAQLSEASLNKINTSIQVRNGLVNPRQCKIFAEFFELFIQVLVNYRLGASNYVPTSPDINIQTLVKSLIRAIGKKQLVPFSQQLYQDLGQLLTDWPSWQADLLVASYQHAELPALTGDQVAVHLKLEPAYLPLLQQACYQRLWREMASDSRPALSLIKTGLAQVLYPYSDSCQQTRLAKQSGLRLTAIAQARQLKPSTISDHYIEIAIFEPKLLLDEWQALMGQPYQPGLSEKFTDYQTFQSIYPHQPFWCFRFAEILDIRVERSCSGASLLSAIK
ncbi:hypothetical protein AWM75_06800 [Aerococcus urinaehominis]|uniref:Uncharacterized protein n=1 Tax=Aerococcus urinaehominis TaxID=128944 RepID=A0A0X8FMC0_9LACT|nr:hypothetical protein [Aerococcus urinaehominis]AMB99709.1 hypothetical protein AWM75_06800 [Aerococcus urinaehominis]SDL91427.1 Uncharacterized protein YpbB [Aerococcus urinaehominis]